MLSNEKFVSKAPADKVQGRERQTGKIYPDARTGERENGGACKIVYKDFLLEKKGCKIIHETYSYQET